MRRTTTAACLALLAASLTLPAGVSAQKKPAAAAGVKTVDAAGMKKVLAAQKGKIVVLNLWATWCGPCVKEFPDLVKLHNNYRAKGVNVVALSLDDARTQAQVAPFLAAQKAGFANYIPKRGTEDAIIRGIDSSWEGAIPTTYVFDRSGKRVGRALVGSQSYEAFEAAVKPLLK